MEGGGYRTQASHAASVWLLTLTQGTKDIYDSSHYSVRTCGAPDTVPEPALLAHRLVD